MTRLSQLSPRPGQRAQHSIPPRSSLPRPPVLAGRRRQAPQSL